MKQFLATLAGLVSGVVVIFLVQFIGHQLTDFKIEAKNFDEFKEAMLNIPAMVIIPVAVAHSLGAIAGLSVARLIEKESKSPLIYVSGVLVLFTLVNLLSLPHPMWFWILDIGMIIGVSLIYILTRKKS
jgi:hypothetical protein